LALEVLSALDKFKANAERPFPPGYPDNVRTFYSPIDDVHGALQELLESAESSIAIAMYGYDDPQLNEILRGKLESGQVFVSMSLDKTQAAGIHEREILKEWQNDGMGNSIAIGRSAKGAIMHLKLIIVDGVDVVTGSTNWSGGGETQQDNQLIVVRDPFVAAEARARIDIIHDQMLKQMAKDAVKSALPTRRGAATRARTRQPATRRRRATTSHHKG
jgi:phosphatidylserine/phosphatidylglycerophosphate/cardiolipin synthase-like enzyme